MQTDKQQGSFRSLKCKGQYLSMPDRLASSSYQSFQIITAYRMFVDWYVSQSCHAFRHEQSSWPDAHKKSFSDDHIKVLQQDVSWEDILSIPELYSQDGLNKASLCRAMQPFQKKSAALQLYLTLRNAVRPVFGLQHPCGVPAVILLAVKYEKASAATNICNYSSSVRDVKSAIKVICRNLKLMPGRQNSTVMFRQSGKSTNRASAFHFRRLMHSSPRSIDGLLKLAADLKRNNLPFLFSADKQPQGRQCDCEQNASPACAFGCCELCCPGPCQHHKKGQVSISEPPLCTSSVASSSVASSNVPALKRKHEVLYMPSITAVSTKRLKVVI